MAFRFEINLSHESIRFFLLLCESYSAPFGTPKQEKQEKQHHYISVEIQKIKDQRIKENQEQRLRESNFLTYLFKSGRMFNKPSPSLDTIKHYELKILLKCTIEAWGEVEFSDENDFYIYIPRNINENLIRSELLLIELAYVLSAKDWGEFIDWKNYIVSDYKYELESPSYMF